MHEARLDRRGALILENEELYTAFQSSKLELEELIPQSRNYPLRITLVATAVFVIITIALQGSGISWQAFPRKFSHLMQTPVNWKTGIILGSVGLLIGGSAFIIYRVTRGKGKFWGDKHYRPVVLRQAMIPGRERIHWAKDMYPHKQLIDNSLLENGTGKTTAVELKGGEHDLISFTTLIIAPIQTVASVAYNAIRFCLVPFYILGRMAQEAITGKPSFEKQRKFKLIDIPQQMALSLYWAVRAPFYGVAYMVAIVYSFIDPMGGRKLGLLVTNEWMEGVDRSASVWTCRAVARYKWEGGGGPEKLGHHAYYWTGCWMPWATVEITDNNITRAYYPGEIFEYDIYLPEESKTDVPCLSRAKDYYFHDLQRTMQWVEGLCGYYNLEGELFFVTFTKDNNGSPVTIKENGLSHLTLLLPLGKYRYVQHDNRLYLIAHVTKREGKQEIFLQKEIQEKPKSVSETLNEWVRNNEGLVDPTS